MIEKKSVRSLPQDWRGNGGLLAKNAAHFRPYCLVVRGDQRV
jgi:hypothetical protein